MQWGRLGPLSVASGQKQPPPQPIKAAPTLRMPLRGPQYLEAVLPSPLSALGPPGDSALLQGYEVLVSVADGTKMKETHDRS